MDRALSRREPKESRAGGNGRRASARLAKSSHSKKLPLHPGNPRVPLPDPPRCVYDAGKEGSWELSKQASSQQVFAVQQSLPWLSLSDSSIDRRGSPKRTGHEAFHFPEPALTQVSPWNQAPRIDLKVLEATLVGRDPASSGITESDLRNKGRLGGIDDLFRAHADRYSIIG